MSWVIPAIARSPCPDEFRQLIRNIQPHTEGPIPLAHFPDAAVEFLGEGIGGSVYLVKPHDGSAPFVFKQYFASGLFGSNLMEHDLAGLELLRHASQNLISSKQLRPIRVLGQPMDETGVKLEYVPGRTIEQLANEATPAVRKRLARLFRRQLETLRDRLNGDLAKFQYNGQSFKIFRSTIEKSDDIPVPEGFLPLVVEYVNTNPDGRPKIIMLIIKPDNVVMTSDGHMRIIDPF